MYCHNLQCNSLKNTSLPDSFNLGISSLKWTIPKLEM